MQHNSSETPASYEEGEGISAAAAVEPHTRMRDSAPGGRIHGEVAVAPVPLFLSEEEVPGAAVPEHEKGSTPTNREPYKRNHEYFKL